MEHSTKPVKRLLVLSNEVQYRAYSEKKTLSDEIIFCDSRRFESFLAERKVDFRRLDEFLLRPRWDFINSWAASKASRWIDCYAKAYLGDINMSEVIFLHFSYILVQALKNYEFAKYLLLTEKPDLVISFESKIKRPFRDFSGNFYLNYFLRSLCLDLGISVETICADEDIRHDIWGDFEVPMRDRIKRFVRQSFRDLYRFYPTHKGVVDVLAYGSLRHLAAVLEEMKNKRYRLAIYDFDFHRDQFAASVHLKASYFIPASFPVTHSIVPDNQAEDWLCQFISLIEKSANLKFWFYEDYDFSCFLKLWVFPLMKNYFQQCLREKKIFDALFSRIQPRSVLVDEDFGMKCAFFTSYVRRKGISVFCVSHASLAVDFSVAENERYFGKSTTFTHSEFERDMYARRGWNPGNLVVTGTPRFDSLSVNNFKPEPRFKTKHEYRILFCAGCLWLHTPDFYGYLGPHFYSLGEIQEPAFLGTLEAIRDLPVSLFLKPHDYEDEYMWKNLFNKHPTDADVHFIKHRENFAQLLEASDALIVSYWSTAITEAAILGKTVFYFEPVPSNSSVVASCQKAGLCKVVYTPVDLRSAISACLKKTERRLESSKMSTERQYFLGVNDGQAAKRVINFIEGSSYAY